MKSEAFANMSLEEQAAKRTAELAAWARVFERVQGAKVMQPVIKAQRKPVQKVGFFNRLFGV